MELRVKVGKELVCDYSGDESEVLVKIGSDDCQRETMWIGQSSLIAALKMIQSMGGGQQAVVVNGSTAQQHTSGYIAPVQPPVKQPVKRQVNMEALQEFEQEIRELAENPPKSRDSEKEGLSAYHVRPLLKAYVPAIGDRAYIFNVLKKYIPGMDRDGFDVLVESSKHV